MAFNSLFADGKSDPATLVFAHSMQSFEGLEDLPNVFLGYTDAVILDAHSPFRTVSVGGYFDLGPHPRRDKLHGVAEQVLKHQGQQGRLTQDFGQRSRADRGGAAPASFQVLDWRRTTRFRLSRCFSIWLPSEKREGRSGHFKCRGL